ncbi:MAG TPA: hypothetical protein VFE86_17815 [Ilumatobacteraceae bacterium]|nr:hypothetical protein [Ilumatobacteraceae bacterium]
MNETISQVVDAPPPKAALRVVNPLVRLVLRTPIARLVEPLALLEFDGRRTGRRRRIVVGWHFIDDQPLVVTPAKWRANFVGGGVATVRWKGNVAEFVGTLDTDPAVVAAAINALLNAGATPRSLALRIPAGHVMSAADVTATRRGIVRFESR